MNSRVDSLGLAHLLDETEPIMLPPAGFDFNEWRARDEREAGDQHALLDLRRELAACTVLVATSASLLNYSIRHSHADSVLHTMSLQCFPSDCSALSVAISSSARIRCAESVVTTLSKLVTRIGLTRASLHGNGVTGKIDSATRLRDICLDCVSISQNLETCMGGPPPDLEHEQLAFSRTVERLAFIAGHGGWPCLHSDGTVAIPDWAERRRLVRLKINFQCELIADGVASQVRVSDISNTGAALNGAPELAQNAKITLTISAVHKIDCKLVWQRGSQCGVRFRRPLDHEQLSEIMRLAD